MSTEAAPLAGKVAIVTGASRGIGHTIARQLAKDGAAVMLTARDTARLQQAVTEIRQAGQRADFGAFDLRQPEAAKQLIEQTVRAFGGIDILINNAGATKRG